MADPIPSPEPRSRVELSVLDAMPLRRFLARIGQLREDTLECIALGLSADPSKVLRQLDAAFAEWRDALGGCVPCGRGEHARCIINDPDGLTCPCPHPSDLDYEIMRRDGQS